MDNVLLRTIFRGIAAYSPDFLSIVRFGVFWSTVSVNFLIGKYYNYLNNIDMVLLWTSYMYGASANTILNYNLVRFGVCMIKLRHERMLILRCILPPKKLNYLQKKINPRLPPEKSRTALRETQVTGNILISRETLSFGKISAFSPPPPPHNKKKPDQAIPL